jgi:hypothetical protein
MMEQHKNNYNIRIDLLKLNGAFMRNMTGKTATKRCLIIPVDDNPSVFLGEKGCYLNMVAYETDNQQYGDTHFVRGDLPKELRERMTDEQRKTVPILGNMRPIKPQQMQVQGSVNMDAPGDQQQDDLPF